MANAIPWVSFDPDLPEGAEVFRRFASRFRKESPDDLRDELRAAVASHAQLNGDLRLRLAESLLLDLADQGWDVNVRAKAVRVRMPIDEGETPTEAKDRIRKSHLVERDNYLRQPAVREFVRTMEQRRLTSKGWQCIYSLMRDGQDLALKLRDAAAITDMDARTEMLASVVQPYIQFVETDAICQHTGLALSDVWRYFRLTWVNAPKSVPGRSMMVLIRDAGAPNHPIIGIAALGSSVVQQEARDNWIGWNAATFVANLQEKPTAKVGAWLLASLQQLVDDIYTSDLIRDEIVTKRELEHPNPSTIALLREEAVRAKARHHANPVAIEHKRRKDGWKLAAETDLFRSKRCEALAKLLQIRAAFDAAGVMTGTRAELVEALKSGAFRTAAGQLVRLKKGAHVGIDMMDITVCGAVAPYNRLIGGKLICALLTSPEVAAFYNKRYADQESVIASSMKGAAIRRKPKLVLLSTTSLYGAGSSQYNRVKIPGAAVGAKPDTVIEYKQLGLSKGFGSFQFSRITTDLIETFLSRQVEGSKPNSIFGEGTNPLMRKIRQAIELLGLPSDVILNHGNPRVVYVIPLAENFREVLLGQEDTPKYFLPLKRAAESTDRLADFWRRRWLARRIENQDVIEDVAAHSLVYPVTHGARIPPEIITAEDEDDLFS
jgi:Druantia protein DruA